MVEVGSEGVGNGGLGKEGTRTTRDPQGYPSPLYIDGRASGGRRLGARPGGTILYSIGGGGWCHVFPAPWAMVGQSPPW